ncbi:MAG: ABC-2 family transporter protein [Kofleriaceae bacterium]
MPPLTAYAAIVAARFRCLIQYRAAALGGLVTQVFFGVVRLTILAAFYAAAPAQASMPLPQATGYIWLGQATLLLIPWRADADVAEQVRSGAVAYELTRPLDLYAQWFARSLAWRTAPMLLRMLPMFAFAMGALAWLAPSWALAPPSAAALAAWLACFLGAVLVSSAVTTLLSVSLLWTLTADGVAILVSTCATIFGGLVIPLPLFPDWSQPLLRALPFAGMLDLPARVFTGGLAPSDAPWVLAHQLGWTVILVGLGRWLLARGLRRLVVQGG